MSSATRPNILLIHCDQLRYDGLGCNGNAAARTPNLDALAGRGRRYARHIVANTICCPSRASLLTGLYPPTHGLWTNGPALGRRDHAPGPLDWTRSPDARTALLAQPATLGDVFAAAGYRTAALGKLHLQPSLAWGEYGFLESLQSWTSGTVDANWTGPYYGFEHVEFVLGHAEKQQASAGHYAAWLAQRDPALARSILANPPEGPHQLYVSPIPTHELHHTTFLAERFEAWLDAAGQGPWCTFVGFPGPHHPFSPTPDILGQFDDWADPGPADPEGALLAASEPHRAVRDLPPQIDMRGARPGLIADARRHTAAMIHQIDRAVGRMLEALERKGMLENTIIVLTSDHGDYLGDHGLLFKHSLAAQSLLHVPFVLTGPGVEAGTDEDPMSNVDVLATLAALAGVEAPPLQHGIDRSRPGSGRDHRALATCFCSINAAADRRLDNFTIYDGRHRYTRYPHRDWQELFDHQADPAETRNVAPDRPDTARALRAELAERLMPVCMPVSQRWGVF